MITPSNPYKTGDETLIWTITKSGDNYTISQGKNYLSWESDNSATISTEAYDLIITKDKDKGTYQIASAAHSALSVSSSREGGQSIKM